MTKSLTANMIRIYEGSVKTVLEDVDDKSVNYFAFTDCYSVFDWGKMPDQIANKGKSLSVLGGFIFNQLALPENWQVLSKESLLKKTFSNIFLDKLFNSSTYKILCQKGLKHHFIGWIDQNGTPISLEEIKSSANSPLMQVHAVDVNRPRKFTVEQSAMYDYERSFSLRHPRLIPLEVVFRFGMPEGSSLKKRLDKNPSYYAELGLNSNPENDVMFDRPVVEFFTKLEPSDRFLSMQEAFLVSGLTGDEFEQLYEMTLLLAICLYNSFVKNSIELWDGKFEFAWTPQGLMLVDSIGPDELRLKYKDVHLSKEILRQYYRDSSWEKALKKAKKIAASQSDKNWKTVCLQELGEFPKPLPSGLKNIIDNLYGALVNSYLGQSVIGNTKSLEEIVCELKQKSCEGGLWDIK